MDTVKLTARMRPHLGKRAARAIRETGQIPAVIYGHKEPPVSISLDRHEVELALVHGARTLDVEMDGEVKQFLIKEVQHDHLDSEPIHLDLMRVDVHERVEVSVAIELRGTAKGTQEGGILDQLMTEIEVECLVTQIPETLHPLINHLNIGDSLLVKDLELPAGVTPLAEPEEIVAIMRASRSAEEDEEATLETGEGSAEPERITRARKEEEEG